MELGIRKAHWGFWACFYTCQRSHSPLFKLESFGLTKLDFFSFNACVYQKQSYERKTKPKLSVRYIFSLKERKNCIQIKRFNSRWIHGIFQERCKQQ